jgi:hypothetical protein
MCAYAAHIIHTNAMMIVFIFKKKKDLCQQTVNHVSHKVETKVIHTNIKQIKQIEHEAWATDNDLSLCNRFSAVARATVASLPQAFCVTHT